MAKAAAAKPGKNRSREATRGEKSLKQLVQFVFEMPRLARPLDDKQRAHVRRLIAGAREADPLRVGVSLVEMKRADLKHAPPERRRNVEAMLETFSEEDLSSMGGYFIGKYVSQAENFLQAPDAWVRMNIA